MVGLWFIKLHVICARCLVKPQSWVQETLERTYYLDFWVLPSCSSKYNMIALTSVRIKSDICFDTILGNMWLSGLFQLAEQLLLINNNEGHKRTGSNMFCCNYYTKTQNYCQYLFINRFTLG